MNAKSIALGLIAVISIIVAIAYSPILHPTPQGVQVNAQCKQAEVSITLVSLALARVNATASALGSYALINLTLQHALSLLINSSGMLRTGECLKALNYSHAALMLVEEAWATLMINATRSSKLNYTCITLMDTARAKLTLALSLTQNATLHAEIKALLNELNTTSCSKVNQVLNNASELLSNVQQELRGRLGKELESRISSAALVYISVGELPEIAVLASLNNTELWVYILQALKLAVIKYAMMLNITIVKLLISGNLTAILSNYVNASRLAEALTILREHNINANEALGVYRNITLLINETSIIYGSLGHNAAELSEFGSLLSQVYLSYINGSLQSTLSRYLMGNITSNINGTIKLLRIVNSSISSMMSKGYLKWSMGSMIIAVPIPPPLRGLLNRYLNLTWGNLTLALNYLNECMRAYYVSRNLTMPGALNEVSIINLAYSLYVARVYCPQAYLYAQEALSNVNNLIQVINAMQH